MKYVIKNIDPELRLPIKNWCLKTLGWTPRHKLWSVTNKGIRSGTVVSFRNEDHYAWFMLRWGSEI